MAEGGEGVGVEEAISRRATMSERDKLGQRLLPPRAPDSLRGRPQHQEMAVLKYESSVSFSPQEHTPADEFSRRMVDFSNDLESVKQRVSEVDTSELRMAADAVQDVVGDLVGWDSNCQTRDAARTQAAKTRSEKQQRIEKFLNALAMSIGRNNAELGSTLASVNRCLSVLISFIACALVPFYVALYVVLYRVVIVLPWDVLQMNFGAALCCFGGAYPFALASVEAFWNMGAGRCYDDLSYVWRQASELWEGDADSIDLEVSRTKERLLRHIAVGMIAIKDPSRLARAMANLWSAALAVVVVLNFKFAFFASLATGIASLVEYPAIRLFGPPLGHLLGADLAHWTRFIVESSIKALSLQAALYYGMPTAACYSALRGGQLFVEGLFALLEPLLRAISRPKTEKGLGDAKHASRANSNGSFAKARGEQLAYEHLVVKGDARMKDADLDSWGCLTPVLQRIDPWADKSDEFDPDSSNIGEVAQFALAAFGFHWQFGHNFSPPFPCDWVLLPVASFEAFLEFMVARAYDQEGWPRP